jgi:hypothetical protein
MKRLVQIAWFWVFFATAGLGTIFGTPFVMIPVGDPVLEDLRFVMRESGRNFRSFTPPLSRDEAALFLDEINENELSEPGRKAYDRIWNRLNPDVRFSNGLFSLDARINLAVEGRGRTNEDIPWGQGEKKSPAFFSLPVDIFFADTLQLAFTPLLAADPFYYKDPDSHFGTNIPYAEDRFDLNMPLRAFAAAGGSWWNFELGRDRLSYGVAHRGNMAISDTPDYYDLARLSFFASDFKYSILVSQMPLSIEDLTIKDPVELAGSDITETVRRYLYLHRLDLRIWKKFSLGISEGIMVGDSAPELRYFNPMMIFHSFFAWRDYDNWGANKGDMTGSLFSIDMDWTILPSFALYGQFVMNEFSTPYELDRYPDIQPPNGLGFMGGLEYVRALGGWRAVFYGEMVYTSPYLYVLSSPFASFIWMRRLSDLGTKDLRYAWLGHPEGRDTLFYALGSSLNREDLAFSWDLSFVQKGNHTILWDWGKGKGYNDEHTPSGTPENRWIFSIGSEWKPASFIKLAGHLGGAMIFEAEHIKGAREYGLEAIFSAVFTY